MEDWFLGIREQLWVADVGEAKNMVLMKCFLEVGSEWGMGVANGWEGEWAFVQGRVNLLFLDTYYNEALGDIKCE